MCRFVGFICLVVWALDLAGQEPLSQYLRPSAHRNDYIAFPFQMMDNLPVAFLTLNGHSHQLFLIDTGSTYTLIAEDATERLGISIFQGSHSEFAASGKEISGRVAKKIRIDSGKFGIYVGPAPVISLSELTSYLGQPVAGILGFDVIRSHPTVIDFTSGMMGIFTPNAFQMDNSMGRIALKTCQTSPIIDAQIQIGNTKYIAALTIDTGNQTPLELYHPYVEKERLMMLEGLKESELAGAGGRHRAAHGLTGSLLIDKRKIELADVYLSQTSTGITGHTDVDGTLGVPVLKNSLLVGNCNAGYAIIN
jgi:predicted aspartyl protease